MVIQSMLDAAGRPCPYCGEVMVYGDMKRQPTRDHVVAKSKVPKGERKKRQPKIMIVCSECNFMKDTMTFEQFIQYLVLKNIELDKAIIRNKERILHIRYLTQLGLE